MTRSRSQLIFGGDWIAVCVLTHFDFLSSALSCRRSYWSPPEIRYLLHRRSHEHAYRTHSNILRKDAMYINIYDILALILLHFGVYGGKGREGVWPEQVSHKGELWRAVWVEIWGAFPCHHVPRHPSKVTHCLWLLPAGLTSTGSLSHCSNQIASTGPTSSLAAHSQIHTHTRAR